MTSFPPIKLTRDVEAVLIPLGSPIFLQKDTEVIITQDLGTTYTVNIYGNLARIDGKDGDALGREPFNPLNDPSLLDASTEDCVWALLKYVFDPEIPVNIVDLGLVYHCEVIPNEQEETYTVKIVMTLTAPGCGMGPFIAEDVKRNVLQIPAVTQVDVELVFDPPWDQSKMSDVAKLTLGLL